MQVNASTSIGTFQNVEVFSIAQGQEFTLSTDEKPSDNKFFKWFADNDPVLSYTPSDDGQSVTVKATGQGETEFQIQERVKGTPQLVDIVKWIFITVTPPLGEAKTVKATVTKEPLTP